MLCFEYEGANSHCARYAACERAALPGDDHRRARGENPPAPSMPALKKLRHSKPRIAVIGVNPHAFGDEEERVIIPALEAARRDEARRRPIGRHTGLQRTALRRLRRHAARPGHVAAKLLAAHRARRADHRTPVLFSSVGTARRSTSPPGARQSRAMWKQYPSRGPSMKKRALAVVLHDALFDRLATSSQCRDNASDRWTTAATLPRRCSTACAAGGRIPRARR